MRKRVKLTALSAAFALALVSVPGPAPALALPDGRGYELVSPPQKNGAEIMPDSQRTRAAADGSALGFASLSGFGDVSSVGASTDYLSVRTAASGTNGWATHAISPPQTPMPFVAATHFMEPAYWGEFSADLSKGVFRSFSPVTEEPLVAEQQNWYLRDDLRTPGAGSYRLLTACPACAVPIPGVTDPNSLNEQSWLAGASADFGHVLFESRLPLTADSTADPEAEIWNLFESDHGTVRLAGVLPGSACGSPPCPAPESWAGMGAHNALYTPGTVSADGTRVFFTAPAAGCAAAFANCGELYLREGHATTVELNASEKTNGLGPGGTDLSGPQPAQYWDATPDGSRAFFLSQEALTDDAPEGSGRKLYMYSVAPDGQGDHLTFLSGGHDDVLGVIGAGADGHSLFYLSAGSPVPGLAVSILRWHDGSSENIGAIPGPDGPQQNLINGASNFIAVPRQSRVSPDGKDLLFNSESGKGLTGYNHGRCPGNGTSTGACRELYLYRAEETPHLLCVSCNPSGAKATADAADVVHTGVGGAAVTDHINHALSDDGRRVFFSSGEALVPEDTNGASDAYEYDVPTQTVHLLSSGTDPSPSYFMDASAGGEDAFILTRQRLVGWDEDGGYDLYDARVGGGLPEPQAPVVCQGETCREAASAPRVAPTIASADFSGPANPKPLKCKKGFRSKAVKGKPRCVKAGKARGHHRRTHRRHGGAK